MLQPFVLFVSLLAFLWVCFGLIAFLQNGLEQGFLTTVPGGQCERLTVTEAVVGVVFLPLRLATAMLLGPFALRWAIKDPSLLWDILAWPLIIIVVLIALVEAVGRLFGQHWRLLDSGDPNA